MLTGLTVCITHSSYTYTSNVESRAFAIVLNIVFIAVFAIALFKQTIVSDYPTIVNYALMWFILDGLHGIVTVIMENADVVTVSGTKRIYNIISGLISLICVLFIWI